MKRALRVLKLEKFFWGRIPGPPSGWTGCHYRPTSALAVPFDAPSLHPGATLHFAQSRKECVRIFWVDRLRPLIWVIYYAILLKYDVRIVKEDYMLSAAVGAIGR